MSFCDIDLVENYDSAYTTKIAAIKVFSIRWGKHWHKDMEILTWFGIYKKLKFHMQLHMFHNIIFCYFQVIKQIKEKTIDRMETILRRTMIIGSHLIKCDASMCTIGTQDGGKKHIIYWLYHICNRFSKFAKITDNECCLLLV